MEIPNYCIVCYNMITPGQSVLLHCECVIAICQTCAILQLTVQHYTYLRGLSCPSCRLLSYNICGIEKCLLEEKRLIQSAGKFFFQKTKSEPSVKQLLKRAIQMGYQSSITLEELDSSEGVNLGVPFEIPMIRLELARLESRRLAKLNQNQNAIGSDRDDCATTSTLTLTPTTTPTVAVVEDAKDNDGSLGPLVHLKISRNVFLEAAIELSQKLTEKSPESTTTSVHLLTNGTESSSIMEPTFIIKDGLQSIRQTAIPIIVSNSPSLRRERNHESKTVHENEKNNFTLNVNVNMNGTENGTENGNGNEQEPEGAASKTRLKQLCICGDEEGGFYVQCANGTGGCNGWVHPECVPKLHGMSKESISLLTDFSCPLCEYKLENLKKIVEGCRVHVTSGKYKGCIGIVLNKNIGTFIKVKFTSDSPLVGTVTSLHIKNLEAEDLVEKKDTIVTLVASSPSSPSLQRVDIKTNINNNQQESQMINNHDSNEILTPATIPVPVPVSHPLTSSISTFSTLNHQDQRMSYCLCTNTGSGKFIECQSEENCKSSRFFHMTCVGYVDSLNRNKQKLFLCQECEKYGNDVKRTQQNTETPQFLLNGRNFPNVNQFVQQSRQRSSMYSLLFPLNQHNQQQQQQQQHQQQQYYTRSSSTSANLQSNHHRYQHQQHRHHNHDINDIPTITPPSHLPPLYLSQRPIPQTPLPTQYQDHRYYN